jgi:hypothetical protein
VPIEYTIDVEKRLVESTITGEVSVDEALSFWRQLPKDPRYQPDFRSLSDYTRAAPFKATGEDIWRLAEALPIAPGARRAILVASDLHYGFGRIVESVRGAPGIAIAVFRDRAEAIAWLETS